MSYEVYVHIDTTDATPVSYERAFYELGKAFERLHKARHEKKDEDLGEVDEVAEEEIGEYHGLGGVVHPYRHMTSLTPFVAIPCHWNIEHMRMTEVDVHNAAEMIGLKLTTHQSSQAGGTKEGTSKDVLPDGRDIEFP